MDVMRSAYRTKMRLFKDSDREDWVRWYPAPEPQKVFPGWHLFASQNWMNNKEPPWPGPGEVKGAPRQFLSGRNAPLYLGECHVGEDRWFREGVPVSALLRPIVDLPDCCGPLDLFAGLGPFAAALVVTGTVAPPPLPHWLSVQFTLEGVSNLLCTDCDNLNATHILTRPNETVGVFTGTLPFRLCGISTQWTLFEDGGGLWHLQAFGVRDFATGGVGWDVRSPLTLEVNPFFGLCGGFPVTVTLIEGP